MYVLVQGLHNCYANVIGNSVALRKRDPADKTVLPPASIVNPTAYSGHGPRLETCFAQGGPSQRLIRSDAFP